MYVNFLIFIFFGFLWFSYLTLIFPTYGTVLSNNRARDQKLQRISSNYLIYSRLYILSLCDLVLWESCANCKENPTIQGLGRLTFVLSFSCADSYSTNLDTVKLFDVISPWLGSPKLPTP
jgi:hypothetical protein